MVLVEPVPLNGFIRDRISLNGLSEKDQVTAVQDLVKKDLEKIHGLVIPGDDFNFPPFRANKPPIAELLRDSGQKEAHTEKTIYGLSAKEFYKRYPKHILNPHADSLIYEGIMISTLSGSAFPILSSCHGSLMYGFIHGAKFRAGVVGHDSHNVRKTEILPGSKAYQLLGAFDTITKHFHKIAILRKDFPSTLINAGWEDDLVEVLEDPQNPLYLGFQGHPELSPNHPALNFLIRNAIAEAQRGSKKRR